MSSILLKSERSSHRCITKNAVFDFKLTAGIWTCQFIVDNLECYAEDAANHPEETYGFYRDEVRRAPFKLF